MKSILVNTGSNLTVTIVKLLITLVMTPVFVHNLGNYDYGIWEILGAVLGYMGLLDFGMKPTISRFAAKYKASDEAQLQVLYSTSFVFLSIVGTCLFTFMLVWGIFWPELLAEGASDTHKYSMLLFIIAVQLLITFPGFVAESFLEGFQKYYLKNNITIINSIIGSVLVYYFITPDNALVLLAGVNAIGLSVKYFIYMGLMMRERFGSLKPSPFFASWRTFKETSVFGAKSLIQGIASRIEIGTDTIVIGVFLGPAMVPFYAIPANLIAYIRNIGWTVTHAFMPLFSSLQAQNKREESRQIYLTASKYVVALMMPMCVGATLIGADFIGIWVGQQYTEQADIIIAILVAYISLPFINPFSSRYLTGIGEHGLLAKVYPVAAIINLIASIALVHSWGIVGVAVGSLIPIFFLVPVVMKHCCKHLELTVSRYLREALLPVVIPTCLMAIVVLAFKAGYEVNTYLKIVLVVGLGAGVYALAFFAIGMNLEEKKWILSKVKT